MFKYAVAGTLLLMTSFLPSVAAEKELSPLEVINKEGQLNISDGSSIYTFKKDGSFHSEPCGISGRTIDGKWQTKDSRDTLTVVVEGNWGWINGISPGNDMRTMKLWIYPFSGEKEVVDSAFGKTSVYRCYFLIDEIRKKS